MTKLAKVPGVVLIVSFTMHTPLKCQSMAFFSTLNQIFLSLNYSIQNTAQWSSSFDCFSIFLKCFSALWDLVSFQDSLCSKCPLILSIICYQTSLSTFEGSATADAETVFINVANHNLGGGGGISPRAILSFQSLIFSYSLSLLSHFFSLSVNCMGTVVDLTCSINGFHVGIGCWI